MSNLLALSENETEDCLSDMVVAGTVSAKTDGLEGIVDFTEQEVNYNLIFSKLGTLLNDDNRHYDQERQCTL